MGLVYPVLVYKFIKPQHSNFQLRLKQHQTISAEESLKINEKITHLIAIERLNLWKGIIYQQFKTCWAKYFDFAPESAPKWLYQDGMIAKLLPIVDLERGARKLAIRIVNRRGGSPPWDFRYEASNVRFVDRMITKGVDMDKWIEGIGSRSYSLNEANYLHIDLSHDPLETINMGGHFKTCLSPGNFNFFSVFANIADVNKQVIYAKNDAGKVVGRVLVGMTARGGVKVFHRYFHDKKEGFEDFALEYVSEWMEQVGAVLIKEGEIPTLMAPDWYDDGAIDIDSGIKCLNENSELRQKLPNIPPKDIFSEIEKQLAPLPVNELTFPMIIQLVEMPYNRELVSDFIDAANKIKYIDNNTVVQLFKLSLIHGCGEYCYSLFGKTLKQVLKKQVNNFWVDNELALGMAQCDAVEILRVFNKVRRGEYFYVESELKDAAVQALLKLGRPKQAEKLLQSTTM